MAEDAKEESVATDDDSDNTAADGSHSLNNTVKQRLLPFNYSITAALTSLYGTVFIPVSLTDKCSLQS